MDNFLIALAFVAQLSDAALTCRTLAQPGGYEANPMLPQSCKGVVAYKAASLAAIPLMPKGVEAKGRRIEVK